MGTKNLSFLSKLLRSASTLNSKWRAKEEQPMNKQRKNRHPSQQGERLMQAIKNKYGDRNDSVAKFERELEKNLNGVNFNTIQTTISEMINGDDVDSWNRKYFLPIERILDVRIADIIDGTTNPGPSPRGLYEIGTQGKYEDFQWLSEQSDGSIDVIRSSDEWSKNIFDYVYESENLDGLRFLIDNNFYNISCPANFQAYSYFGSSEEKHALILLKMLAKGEDGCREMFIRLFDTREGTDLIFTSDTILWNDNILEIMIKSPVLLEAACRGPELVSESTLNQRHRITGKEEYQAVCASNWLTPLLCYALKHEDKYRRQALQLLKTSQEVADYTRTHIGKNLDLLGPSVETISTKKGYLLIGGGRSVIGVLGEPLTDQTIQDPELRQQANKITATIASIRSLSKFQNPVLINGKMHVQRINDNNVYKEFIRASKGKPYLFQEADSKDGDSHGFVFIAPKGIQAKTLTSEQWFQIGQALRSIHEIPTGKEGTAYCHGPFYYSNFYLLPNGKLEYVGGYSNVYIGSPEEDLLNAGLLAFQSTYLSPKSNQEFIRNLLKGYGLPFDGFLNKLIDSQLQLARSSDTSEDIRLHMNVAAELLAANNAINSKNN